jgi:hypothetical protein
MFSSAPILYYYQLRLLHKLFVAIFCSYSYLLTNIYKDKRDNINIFNKTVRTIMHMPVCVHGYVQYIRFDPS